MILSQRQLEEIAASTTKDFNRFFFGDEADKPDRSALPTSLSAVDADLFRDADHEQGAEG